MSLLTNERQDLNGPDAAIELIDVVVQALYQFADQMLVRHSTKAKKHREKHLLTPYMWLVTRRIRKLAGRIRALPALRGDAHAVVGPICSEISRASISASVQGHVIGAVVKALFEGNGTEAAAKAIVAATKADTASEKITRFFALQSILDLEAALSCGEDIVKSRASLSPRQLRKLSREPSMLLAARRLLVEKAESPAWATPGKIAYIAATSLPYNVTGYTTRTQGVAQGYKKGGFDIEVLTRPSFPLIFHPHLNAKKIPDVELVEGVAYHRILKPDPRKNNPGEWVRLAADALEQKIRALEPELVVAASNYMNSLPALIAARRLGLPFAYEVRGMWELTRDSQVPGYSQTADFAVTVLLETFVAKNADRVLTLTEPMRQDLITRGVHPDRIALMPNGVDEESVVIPARDERLANALNIPGGVPVIGYVGSIIDYEGLPDLARACVGLSECGYDFRLLIVGGEKRHRFNGTPITDEIRSAFQGAGIIDKLIMPGRVPFSEVASYYSLIDIAPIPRRPYKVSEMVSPIKPVEALAMGKVLIVSDVEALKDFAQQGQTGLAFQKGNTADLQAKLQQALDDPSLREMLKKNAQNFVRTQRTWPAICRRAAEHMGVHSSVA